MTLQRRTTEINAPSAGGSRIRGRCLRRPLCGRDAGPLARLLLATARQDRSGRALHDGHASASRSAARCRSRRPSTWATTSGRSSRGATRRVELSRM